jgi:prepilin-type N-terminal cleavage/methylation domain-containing protein
MKRGEKGFTLIEVLVVVFIMALIAGGATMTIAQVLGITKNSNDRTTAIRQVQSAGYWISRDSLMAQSVITDDDPGTLELEFITLSWTAWGNSDVHKVVYTFEDMPTGLKKLKRQHFVYDINGLEIGNDMMYIAQNIIDSASFSAENGVWILSIGARSGTKTENREYEIIPRVEGYRLI